MRIAMLTNNHFPPGEGIGQHVSALATRLQDRGHDVQILARGLKPRQWEDRDCHGLRVREYPYLPLKPFHHLMTGRVLQPWLEAGAGGAELLHVHMPLLPPLQTALPILTTFHSPMLTDNAAITEGGVKPWAMRTNARLFSQTYEQWYLDHSRALIAVSHGVRAELDAHYSLAGRIAEVVGNAVDMGFFNPDPTMPRGEHILFVGRLAYRKGLSRLLDAFALLPRSGPRKLELIGTGPLEADLRNQAHRLGIADRVIFRGFLDRSGVREALRRAALFVNPADYETGPLTLLEAMACVVPVVSTRTGLVAEFGSTPPLWLSPANVEGLAGALATAWNQRQDPRNPRKALDLVRSRFAWDQRVDSIEALYERVLSWRR